MRIAWTVGGKGELGLPQHGSGGSCQRCWKPAQQPPPCAREGPCGAARRDCRPRHAPALGASSPRSARSPTAALAFSLGRSRDTSHSKRRLETTPTSLVHRKPPVDPCSETGSSPDNVIRTVAANTSLTRKLSSPSPPPVLLSTPRSCNKQDKLNHSLLREASPALSPRPSRGGL